MKIERRTARTAVELVHTAPRVIKASKDYVLVALEEPYGKYRLHMIRDELEGLLALMNER